ncbi:hypothetical protein L596_012406 [Steinernema carpocapsae]|nr:hypothetical protein L596_012406 [Steinernema carpocapsae]
MKCMDSCKNNDESMCLGPEQPKATTILQVDAPGYEEGKCGKGVHCPIGHFCYDGDGKVLCCPTEYEDAFSQAHNLVCPNGTKAAGVYEGFFIATVAKTCDDLICDPGYACQQVNKYFANCCEDKANM